MGVIRVLDEAGIEALLHSALIGRIACCDHIDGPPYMVPISFGYDGEALYAHSGPGKKIDIMRRQPLVTFEVDSGSATDQWQSVIAEGRFEELLETEAINAALQAIYAGSDQLPEFSAVTIFYRIALTSKSGRYERPD